MADGQLDLIDGHGLAEQVERRAALAQAAGAVMDALGSDNTTRAFADDWRAWCEFVEHDGAAQGVEPMEASDHALLLFAVWLASARTLPDGSVRSAASPATIKRRLTGVVAGWKKGGQKPPHGITADARKFVDKYHKQLVERNLPTGRGQAPPLTIREARLIAETTPPDLAGRRDLALVLMAFAIAGRRSEVAHLDVSDITPDENGLYVHVRFSKTKPRKPAVLYGQKPETCPVRAWKRWQEASGIVTGAAFRQVDRHGNLGARMSGEAVGAVITRAGQRAQLSRRLTGHSPRAGLATEARRAGHDITTIAAQGGWDPEGAALHGYIRIVDQWTDNPLAGIGL